MAMVIVGAGDEVGFFGSRISLVGYGDGRRVVRIVGVYVNIDGDADIVGSKDGKRVSDDGLFELLGDEVGSNCANDE